MTDPAFLSMGLLVAALLAAGAAAGFAGGLFGIGGGVVTVPVLFAVFHAHGASQDVSLKTAIGTSLAVIVVTSLRSLTAHHAAGHVDGRVLRAWAPWIALGAAAGGIVARWAPAEALAVVFAAGAFYVAFKKLAGRAPAPGGGREPGGGRDLSSKAIHIPIGLGTGLFSSLMGLGGGAVGVMVMTWSGRSIHQAVATASGFGVAVALPGAAGFVVSGLWASGHWTPGQEGGGLPPGSLGYVNLLAFAAMGAASAVAAPFGARLAHRTDSALLSKLFGAYVGVAALGLLWEMLAP